MQNGPWIKWKLSFGKNVGLGRVLRLDSKDPSSLKDGVVNWTSSELEEFAQWERVKQQAIDWELMFANHISDKGRTSIYNIQKPSPQRTTVVCRWAPLSSQQTGSWIPRSLLSPAVTTANGLVVWLGHQVSQVSSFLSIHRLTHPEARPSPAGLHRSLGPGPIMATRPNLQALLWLSLCHCHPTVCLAGEWALLCPQSLATDLQGYKSK